MKARSPGDWRVLFDRGVDAIRPDIVGEAFLLRVLGADGRTAAAQAAIVARAWQRDPAAVVGSMIRTAHDYAEDRPGHPALAWLDHLLAGASSLGAQLGEQQFAF